MLKNLGGLLLATAALASCSFNASVGGKSLDQGEAETEILAGLTESVGVAPKAVDCTGISDLEVEEGNTFMCTGTAPSGDPFDIEVTLTDDEGGFKAIVPG